MKQKFDYYVAKMKKSKIYGLAIRHPRRTEFLLVSLFFGLLAALFMGPILFHFGSSVHGFWGDGTGGLIWLANLNLPPFGGPTDAIVYPYGDDLFRPDMITASFWILPFWFVSKAIGAVATWNLTIFLSFWLCGVSMYYLIKRLVGSRMAATWAGVAFAYLPMHQYKAFGHIAYELTFVFVFVLWQVLNFAEKPSRRNAILLGLAFAAPFYIDGYYVLFTLIMVGVPLTFLFLKRAWKLGKKTVDEFKSFVILLAYFLGTSLVALLPIVYCKLVYGAQISAGLALARGDFMSNVNVYTARWYDYVLPIETHPFFGKWVTDFRLTHNHGSNTSEQTLYLGFVVMGLAAWTMYYFWKRRKASSLQKTTKMKPETLLMLILVAFVAFLITLQPFFHLMGHRVPMPSGVISVLVQYWRVYARLVLIIQLLLVVVAATGLAILLNRFRSRAVSIGLGVLLIIVTLFEYMSFNPFHRQDIWYYDKLSSTNTWLAKQRDIKVIAVYPLVDQPDGLASLYTTEQKVNGKKMINAGTVTAKEARLRASITGLNDPQTLSVLKALGAQAVMTHEIANDRSVPGLRFAYGASDMPAGYATDVDLFRLENVTAAKYALVAQTGFKDVLTTELSTKYFVNTTGLAELKVENLPGVAIQSEKVHRVTFGLETTAAYAGNDVVLMQDDHVVDVLHIKAGEKRTLSYDIKESSNLKLMVVGQLKEESLFINRLQAE
jgi:hypothetical protein